MKASMPPDAAFPSLPFPSLSTDHLRPGMRVAVACSGGADSVALLRALLEQRAGLGLVLSVAHMNHGIRGAESDGDEAFVGALSAEFGLPFHARRVATPAAAEANGGGIEEAARNLRYGWFWQLLAAGGADAVVTAHTLNDQAETVLHRLMRGAWTEGLGGIHPVLQAPDQGRGIILRPFLATTRSGIEAWLRAIGQPWREDSTNRDTGFTRNRIRHELLPILAEYNPAIQKQFAQLGALARDEEAYWQIELARLLPSLLLPGRAVRGGGRATDTLLGDHSLSIEIERLRLLHPALRRRVVRAAADKLGSGLGFDDTERLLALCGLGTPAAVMSTRPNGKIQMAKGLRAERTPRELRLFRIDPVRNDGPESAAISAGYSLPIPGTVEAPAFGVRLDAAIRAESAVALPDARLRTARPGDRVTLRHSRSAMKIKEALQRMRRPAPASTPVLEWQGEIVWLAGVEVESNAAQTAGLVIRATPL